MKRYEADKLEELIHPLDDAMGFYIDIVETYAKKLRPEERFEIRNACKSLKRLRLFMLGIVTELIESSTRAEVEQTGKDKQEKRLALLQGKDDAFSVLAAIIEQQRQAIQEQVRQEGTTLAKSTRPKRR